MRTVQYVSPQVWAWRQGRVRTMRRACDLVLCLLPFEPPFYAGHGVRAEFVGHPLADQIPLESERGGARARAGLAARSARSWRVLPGSRRGEVARLGPPICRRDALARGAPAGLGFVAPMAECRRARGVRAALARARAGRDRAHRWTARRSWRWRRRMRRWWLRARRRWRRCCASARWSWPIGSAPLTAWLLRALRLLKPPFFSLPNLLAGRGLVPEFFQEQVQPSGSGPAVLRQLERPRRAELARLRRHPPHAALRRERSGPPTPCSTGGSRRTAR